MRRRKRGWAKTEYRQLPRPRGSRASSGGDADMNSCSIVTNLGACVSSVAFGHGMAVESVLTCTCMQAGWREEEEEDEGGGLMTF